MSQYNALNVKTYIRNGHLCGLVLKLSMNCYKGWGIHDNITTECFIKKITSKEVKLSCSFTFFYILRIDALNGTLQVLIWWCHEFWLITFHILSCWSLHVLWTFLCDFPDQSIANFLQPKKLTVHVTIHNTWLKMMDDSTIPEILVAAYWLLPNQTSVGHNTELCCVRLHYGLHFT